MMAKRAKTESHDEQEPTAAPEGARPDEPRPRGDGAGPEGGTRAGGEGTGAPATDDQGPSLEDLVPGIGEALAGESDADEARTEASADARTAELEAENAELKDRLLRALAELENTRRRAERDRRDAETYGGTRLARDLLVVYDNLTRALAAADDELRAAHGAFLEGVELTRRELVNAFGKHRIERVSPERGSRFDPHLHQAMFEAPVPGAPDGTIIEVMEDGFIIADRLLRPARVGVAKGGQASRQAAGGGSAGAGAAGANGPERGNEGGAVG